MVRAYVSLGSNIERERHIPAGVAWLAARYAELTSSSVYESEAVGFEGAPFFNLVVGFDTDQDVHALARALRRLETHCGRDREAPRFGSRTLDADLLLYGDLVAQRPELALPRAEILTQAFVLRPLAEVAGQLRHPLEGRTYAELWMAFGGDRACVWPARFDLNAALAQEPDAGRSSRRRGCVR
jgi:2-amino-4-hydroxy-6-hydroxymethyldihydropteridine diphosphokinase